MKNVVVFTSGDANNPSTWSNVPYLFTNTLEKKGFNVIRIDMSNVRNIFTLAFNFLIKIIKPSSTFYFARTKLNRFFVERKIKKAVQKFDDIADFYISISYDFSPSKFTLKKVILFHDWPIEYLLKSRFNREPDFLEIGDVKRHEKIIKDADIVVSLFEDCAEFMENRYNRKVYYLGGLINAFDDYKKYEDVQNRNKITFIGKKSYKDCAIKLIKAFNQIENSNIELHIIGMTKKDFIGINTPNNIKFHGYLDKGNEVQREEYYNIIKESVVIVNTSEKWAGMSSLFEVLYYYRPIIVSRFDEFVRTFGDEIDFGFYSKNSVSDIKSNLEKILSMNKKDYKKMIANAHNSVKDYSYSCYIDKLLDIIKANN